MKSITLAELRACAVSRVGTAKPAKRRRTPSANAQVRLTCAPEGMPTIATRDLNDRAHEARDERGEYIPAKQVRHATPRRYPASHMTSRGVSHDSAADALYAAELRLRRLLGDLEDSGSSGAGLSLAEAYHAAKRHRRNFGYRRAADLPEAEAVLELHRQGNWRPEE